MLYYAILYHFILFYTILNRITLYNITLSFTYKQIKAIEDEIDLGQIEEVILMAQDELSLADYYNGESCL